MEQDDNIEKREESETKKEYSFSCPEDVLDHPDAPKRLIEFWLALKGGKRLLSRMYV